jgi:4-hydroxy 2-oxovalerate aldolase
MNQATLLDCTLRDGGYYNLWNFNQDLIQEYVYAMNDSAVDVVEIGFRFLRKDNNKGACAYSSDSFIQSLDIPNNLTLCVMINAADILSKGKFNKENLNKLFPSNSKTSKISIIRIASHASEFIEALNAVDILKNKGYKIGFNLMQVSEAESNEVLKLSKFASNYPIEVLYFADSLGNMNTKKISKVIKLLKTHWKGALGFHAHDNMALAFSNTIFALENGVEWIDSTVLGMGRGAGNVKTELVAIELSKIRNQNLKFTSLISLITNKFKPLKLKYSWGTNSFYFLSGRNGVHPSYVQEILSDSIYNEHNFISIIEHLGLKGANEYSKDILRLVLKELKLN